MTDYRLSFRSDSRHWLAIAKATEDLHPGGLSTEWKERLESSLSDLNQDVYGGGERFDNSNSHAVEITTPAPGDSGGAAAAPSAPASAAKAGTCRANDDCPAGQICDGKFCTQL